MKSGNLIPTYFYMVEVGVFGTPISLWWKLPRFLVGKCFLWATSGWLVFRAINFKVGQKKYMALTSVIN